MTTENKSKYSPSHSGEKKHWSNEDSVASSGSASTGVKTPDSTDWGQVRPESDRDREYDRESKGGGSRVCKYYPTKRGCRNGDGCRFLHQKPIKTSRICGRCRNQAMMYENHRYCDPCFPFTEEYQRRSNVRIDRDRERARYSSTYDRSRTRRSRSRSRSRSPRRRYSRSPLRTHSTRDNRDGRDTRERDRGYRSPLRENRRRSRSRSRDRKSDSRCLVRNCEKYPRSDYDYCYDHRSETPRTSSVTVSEPKSDVPKSS